MTDDDKAPFSTALRRLFAAWNQEPTAQQLASWWAALRDLPLRRVQDAVALTLKTATGNYPPAPAVVRKAVQAQADDGHLPDAARHQPGCTGCTWVTIDQRHPQAGQDGYKPDATRSRAVRGCRVDLHGMEAA